MLSELDARRTDHSPVSGRTVPLIGRCPERVHTRTSCCVLRLPYFATSAVALPYSQAPTPCHPALWRAPAVPMQCNISMLPAPAPVCSKGVRSPAEPASAPRLLAADRRYGHLGPESAWIVANRPSSMPGRVWSSLVFAGRSAFPLNRLTSTGCDTLLGLGLTSGDRVSGQKGSC